MRFSLSPESLLSKRVFKMFYLFIFFFVKKYSKTIRTIHAVVLLQ